MTLVQVTLESHFIEQLGLDSLDAVELVMAFEDEFGTPMSRGHFARSRAAGLVISDADAEAILTGEKAVKHVLANQEKIQAKN